MQTSFEIATRGQGLYEFTRQVQSWAGGAGARDAVLLTTTGDGHRQTARRTIRRGLRSFRTMRGKARPVARNGVQQEINQDTDTRRSIQIRVPGDPVGSCDRDRRNDPYQAAAFDHEIVQNADAGSRPHGFELPHR